MTSPTVLAPALLVLVSGTQVPSYGFAALGWGLVAVTFAGLLPLTFLLSGVRKGRWTDRHVDQRSARPAPLAFAMGSVLAGILLLKVGGAPPDLLALVVAMFAGLAVVLVVSLIWKVSIHTAVAGGSAVVVALLFPPAGAAVGVILVLGAGWSRLALHKHTVSQIAVGAALGAAVAGSLFPVLR